MRAAWRVTGEKACKSCGIVKELSAFYRAKDGQPHPKCRECIKVKNPKIAARNRWKITGDRKCTKCLEVKLIKEFVLNANGSPQPKCLDCAAAMARAAAAKMSVHERQARNRKNRFRQFNFSQEKYDEMLVAQRGGCAICGTTSPVGRKYKHGRISRFSIDHCHSTGKVRGLLCMKCNMGLGLFGDSPDNLSTAIKYLVGGL